MEPSPVAPPAPDVTSFFTAWEVYRAVLEADCLEHKEIYRAVHEILSRRSGPYSLLDLGCGDAAAIGPAMVGTPAETYVGIDCAAPALELARTMLTDAIPHLELRVADLMETIESSGELFDVILVSFALHHFQDVDKKRFLRAARKRIAPGGELLLIDVVRLPGQTREAYLDHYVAMVAGWPLDDDKKTRIVAHVTGFDFPADVEDEPAWARALGYTVHEFYRAESNTQIAWRLTVA